MNDKTCDSCRKCNLFVAMASVRVVMSDVRPLYGFYNKVKDDSIS